MKAFKFIAFTKSWNIPLAELASRYVALGLQGIELAVRDGYPVNPGNMARMLPEAAGIFADQGLFIASIASAVDEPTIAACGAAQVPLLRVCPKIPPDQDLLSAIAGFKKQWDTLIPALDRHGVAIGVQNHCDRYLANAGHLFLALNEYDPRHVCAVWDPAHNAIHGGPMELALDLVISHLRAVNLKNAFWRLTSGPEADKAVWKHYWTTGPHGLADWSLLATELRRRGWSGNLCFSAEYTHPDPDQQYRAGDELMPLLRSDIEFAKSLFVNSGEK